MNTENTLNKKNKEKVVVSWTGGKDGCFACYKTISEGFDVSYLLNFRDMNRRRSHEINPELLHAQSEAIGIPIIQIGFQSYEQEFKKETLGMNYTSCPGRIVVSFTFFTPFSAMIRSAIAFTSFPSPRSIRTSMHSS